RSLRQSLAGLEAPDGDGVANAFGNALPKRCRASVDEEIVPGRVGGLGGLLVHRSLDPTEGSAGASSSSRLSEHERFSFDEFIALRNSHSRMCADTHTIIQNGLAHGNARH